LLQARQKNKAMCILWLPWKAIYPWQQCVSQVIAKHETFELNLSLTCANYGICMTTCATRH